MQFVFGLAGVALAVILLPFVLKAQAPGSSETATSTAKEPPMETPTTASSPVPLVRVVPLAELKQRLEALDAEAEAKAKLAPPPTAMCYSIAVPAPDKAIPYHCPTCGTQGSMPATRKYELDAMRKQISLLKDFSGRLDESFLCSTCSRGKKKSSRSFALELTIPEQPSPRKVPVTLDDLQLLTRFLTKPDFTIDTTGPEATRIAERIHRLLGIPQP